MHECKKFLNLHYFLKMMNGFQNPIPKHALNYACLEAISVQLFLTPLVSEKQKNLSYKPFRLSDTNQN